MDIFVINLDRNPERLQAFERINPHLGDAKRWPASEGKTVNHADLLTRKLFAEPITYTNGAIGNALSHLGLWERAAKSPSYITVLEDDAIVHKDFETIAPQLIAELAPDWDFILWGWNFDTVMSFDLFAGTPCAAHFSQNDLRTNWDSIQKNAVRPALHRLHYAFGTIGYSISTTGAKKLAKLALPIKPFLYKIPAFDLEIQNDALDCVLATQYGHVNAYACFPPLILTRNDRTQSTTLYTAADEMQRSIGLEPVDALNSRKLKRKHARYLFAKGDLLGGALWFLKYLATPPYI
jgi:glycosyl transferase, family 25